MSEWNYPTYDYSCNRDHCTPEERIVIDAAVLMFGVEREVDSGSNTIARTNAVILMQRAMETCRKAVALLLTTRGESETK